ncbi:hypothetical protein GLOIN_2v1634331 [Rhizophagus irregularis DAOM 181602=DAOM 197198]|uniref:Uncharacterized protein n=1 Tax=Rhizophagus irregularis (strain DAOM 181602 / DAOM 197198 / MUCL 43194) TaxID=747089 RepID=A0A2P4PTG4_RHIID|nr:hypothetical protein GLOIN_2v1634331 [Rhizophagus irregularis DAOM 181602=DAOM 197198]POG68675.1 hypothetical protein GLOIN_2v1634331 [Rhizophagus irregularis DAOM 181602=DAOM 197198]|eukprot:XP_025175541.1 hypothetical protein GLOIN_2v1634331 [Rhizophagus irregularis DAOM 181602=DAOM 197198]
MSSLIRLCLNLLIIVLKKIIGIEWEYDTLSVVKPGQSIACLQDLGMARWLILTIISPESIRIIWLFVLIALG